jgi:hypothetical protein
MLSFQANRVDSDGFIIEPVIVLPTDVIESNIVIVPVPEGLYIPQWTGTKWVEGATKEYINNEDSRTKGTAELELLKQENTLLKAQVQAAADRSEFHEELIAEMAMLLYP